MGTVMRGLLEENDRLPVKSCGEVKEREKLDAKDEGLLYTWEKTLINSLYQTETK